MKYVIILCDGMADYPVKSLDGKTPLSVAKKPMMDHLASLSEVGLVKTVPDGLAPGSDVANLGVLGYDARQCYTGRSPLEALSIGVALSPTDLALRANLVTLSDHEDFDDKVMLDYSAGEISSEESLVLMEAVKEALEDEGISFYCGTSYRHLAVIKNGADKKDSIILTPPHNISGQTVGTHLPQGAFDKLLTSITKRSHEVLKNHPINRKRVLSGQKPANNLWFWGQGTAPALDSFKSKYGVNGAVISAVDLLKGIAVGAQMSAPKVDGATGTLGTNFEGKAQKALECLDTHDFVFVHIEAPDECGHQKDLEGKIRAIELIDERVLTPIFKGLCGNTDYRIMVLPDHPTPLSKGTHTAEPVPYFIYDSRVHRQGAKYDEHSASTTGNFFEYPWLLASHFFEK
jgi:2,3-bisphosphoglycerate-independent phosphoglycerate mutase